MTNFDKSARKSLQTCEIWSRTFTKRILASTLWHDPPLDRHVSGDQEAAEAGSADMSETTAVSEGPSGTTPILAAEEDAASGTADAYLPDDIQLEPAERQTLVADFRRVRDAYRGRFAVDVRELGGEPTRIATALALSAEDATRDE